MLQELVLTELLRRGPALHIHTETHAEKGLELLTKFLRLLKSGCSVRGDQIQRLKWLLIEIRRLGLDHFDGHDPEGPDVDFAAVFLLFDDFGGHPVGCADHGRAFGALLGEFGAEAEVGDFDGAARGEEDVVGFDVAVDNVLAVEVNEAFACLDSKKSAAVADVNGYLLRLPQDKSLQSDPRQYSSCCRSHRSTLRLP